MGTFLSWVLIALVAAGLAFGVVALVTGRVTGMADMPPDATPGLPPGPIGPADLAAARFDLGFRGYRMDQVDALLDRLSQQLAASEVEPPGRHQVAPPSTPSVPTEAIATEAVEEPERA